jgi:predicted RNA-binding protein YlqC (UPF0109 family)
MDLVEQLKKLAEDMLRLIVNHTDKVRVHVVRGRMNVVLEAYVDPEDYGYALGVEGRNANAMRTILYAAVKRHSSLLKIQFDVITDPETKPKG